MHTWAKRGVQTAFVTGGLLMLGTGIASAQENVNPDAAPPAVDAGVSVPIKVEKNNLGTPVKNVDVPTINREISTDRVTSAVPTKTAAPANPLVRKAGERLQGTPLQGIIRGNTIQAHVDVPIHICGNAIAVLGDAHAEADCESESHREAGIVTDGEGQALAGNIVAANWVAPFQITGNAIAALGNAETHTTASQEATTGGDYRTNGDKGVVSGNAIVGQWATPFQVTGNAVGGAGIANAESEAETKAVSDGSIWTSGKDSTLSGNVAGIPLAPLFEVNGNAIAGAGNADTDSKQTGIAQAGGVSPGGINDIDTWVQTNGDPATGAGNVVQPQLAGPITVDDNAGAVVGNSAADSETVNEADAGGFTSTSGEGSTAAGNIVDAPVALPVSAAGDSAAVIGNTETEHTNTSNTSAGSGTYTNGDDSVLSANTASVPPATSVDVCGDSAAAGGQASGDCTNDVSSEAGGYNGTTGNDSVGSGNIGTVPVAVPVETYGVTAAGAGTGEATATEEKDVRSSGTPNTEDDNGTVSSNIATAPTAAAPQVIGNTAGLVANTYTDTTQDTEVTAGGNPHATGKKSSVSGNIVQVPTSTPAQVFGTGATGVGNNKAVADNSTDMKAGGDASSTGEDGSITGNIISAPVGSGTQVQGESVGAGSNVDAVAVNDLDSVAGGDVTSNGDGGSVAGNAIAAQAAPFVPTPGNTVSGAGITTSDATSDTNVVAGGNTDSSAEDASVSGNLIHAPANAQPGVYGDAVAVAGQATTVTDKVSFTQAGGEMDTLGSGPLTAREITVPAEAAAKVKEVPAEVLGQATTDVTEDDTQITGEEADALRAAKGIQLPKSVDHHMGATEVPNLSSLKKLPVNQTPDPAQAAALLGQLPAQGLPQVPALPSVAQERAAFPVGGSAANLNPNVQGVPLQEVLALAGTLLPGGQERSLPTLPAVPSLPVTAPALPVNLPLAPVATERSADLPKLPLDGPASLSGLHLNPTQDLPEAPVAKERSLPVGPAMNVVDTKTVFSGMSGLL